MIFVDTNYFLRLLLKDISEQHKQAKSFFLQAAEGKVKIFTSLIVLFEIYWVLSSFYGKKKEELVGVLDKVLGMEFVKVEERDFFKQALVVYKNTALDLEDSYNLVFAKSRKATAFKTFDARLKSEFLKSN